MTPITNNPFARSNESVIKLRTDNPNVRISFAEWELSDGKFYGSVMLETRIDGQWKLDGDSEIGIAVSDEALRTYKGCDAMKKLATPHMVNGFPIRWIKEYHIPTNEWVAEYRAEA